MLHVLKRLLLVIVGYVVAVVVALVAVVLLYFLLSSLPGAPSYFGAMSLSPLVVLAAPGVGLFALLLVLVLSVLPALVLALIAELFSLRQVWLFALAGAVIGGGCFVYVSAPFLGTINGSDWADLGIVSGSGLIGGLVYWLFTGRQAGFTRPAPADIATVPAA